jgi:hypothetical protein
MAVIPFSRKSGMLDRDRTGSFKFGLSVIPFVLLAAAGIVLGMRRRVTSVAGAATIGEA